MTPDVAALQYDIAHPSDLALLKPRGEWASPLSLVHAFAEVQAGDRAPADIARECDITHPDDVAALRAREAPASRQALAHVFLTLRDAPEKTVRDVAAGITHPEDLADLAYLKDVEARGGLSTVLALIGALVAMRRGDTLGKQAAAKYGLEHQDDVAYLEGREGRVGAGGLTEALLTMSLDRSTAEDAAIKCHITHPDEIACLKYLEAREARLNSQT
ncbi:hypothetical protein LJR230_000759 [Trinickia sp. LjRoot230]|uniref:hypothetical protein n=1 Tax=Trinickia sp. LjRoot230 TaxID=3342288 RepID=UPI003ECDAA34